MNKNARLRAEREAQEADEHYIVRAAFTDCAEHEVRFETQAEAIAAAQSTRDAFPGVYIAVCINRYGQNCAISADEWWPFPAKQEAPVSEQFHPNMIECWDDPLHTTPEEKEHAEMEPLAHFMDCDCPECEEKDLSGVYHEHVHHATGGYMTIVVERTPNDPNRYFVNYADETQLIRPREGVMERIARGTWTLVYSTVEAPSRGDRVETIILDPDPESFTIKERFAPVGAALLLALTSASASLPDHCTITRTVEDGAYATCDNGQELYYDADGQSYPNEYGQPTRPAGWVAG